MGMQLCSRDWLILALRFLFFPLCPEVCPTQANQLRVHAWRVLARTDFRVASEQRGKPRDPWRGCWKLAEELSMVLKGGSNRTRRPPPPSGPNMWNKQILVYLKY